MKIRLTTIAAFGLGYVAGSAAGRDTYEQLRGLTRRVTGDPWVQQGAHEAAEFARSTAGTVRDRVAEEMGERISLVPEDELDPSAERDAAEAERAWGGQMP